MLKDERGLIFIEVLITFSLVLMSVSLMLPTTMMIKGERQVQKERLEIIYRLQTIIHEQVYEKQTPLPYFFTENIYQKQVHFNLKLDNDFIKGCAKWKNVKQQEENFCLYAPQ